MEENEEHLVIGEAVEAGPVLPRKLTDVNLQQSRSSVTMRKTLPVPCRCSSFSIFRVVVVSFKFNWVQERKMYCLGSSRAGIEAK